MSEPFRTEVPFPLDGLDRRLAYADQSPVTTPDCLNVRPSDVIEGRKRIGSRPGLNKAFYEELGGGTPIRMLNTVSYVGGGYKAEEDNFDGSEMSDDWSANAWDSDGLPAVVDGKARGDYGEDVGAVYKTVAIDTLQQYTVDLYLTPYNGRYCGKHRIYARMDDVSPSVLVNGVVAELDLKGDQDTWNQTVSGSLKVYFGGDLVGTHPFTSPGIDPMSSGAEGWFSLVVDGDNIRATWLGADLLGPGGVAIIGHTGTRTGFGLTCENKWIVGLFFRGYVYVDKFRIQHYASVVDKRTYLMASAGGNLYRDNGGVMELVSADLVSDRPLYAAEHLQKLYIANHDGPTGSAVPKVYDPDTNTLSDWVVSAGALPLKCLLIARYRDRCVLAGYPMNEWYMSRAGDFTDFDYNPADPEDPGRAVSGQNSKSAGLIGDKITALGPYADDYLMFGCQQSLYVLRGDPAYGGQIDKLSETIGVVGPAAWCPGPTGEFVFLSHDGIYFVPYGAQTDPKSLSRERMPRELLGLQKDVTVSMAYDVMDRGVLIALTREDGAQATHYWLDWATKGIWPVTFDKAREPLSILARDGVILFGCRDGYIRNHSWASALDDGESFESYVTFGPVRLSGKVGNDGIWHEVVGKLAGDSGPVLWAIRVGDTERGALRAASFYGGVWYEGLNYADHPEAGGAAGVLVVSGVDGAGSWAIESIESVFQDMGLHRLS